MPRSVRKAGKIRVKRNYRRLPETSYEGRRITVEQEVGGSSPPNCTNSRSIFLNATSAKVIVVR
jgi:hypothetical protein